MELHAGISDIRLYTDEVYIHVEVKSAGIWFEVIRERKSGVSIEQDFIDHFVTAGEIRQLYLERKAEVS